jgi:hypothetical protein
LTNQNNPIKPANDYLRYSSMAFQMIAIMGVGIWLGIKIDHWLHLHFPVFTTILAILSVFGAIAYFIRETLKK